VIRKFKHWVETSPWDEWIEAHEQHLIVALLLFIATLYFGMRALYGVIYG